MRLLWPLSVALAGCAAPAAEPEVVDSVHVEVFTEACAPQETLGRAWVAAGEDLTLSWEALCTRDALPIVWWALKVSLWEDRADDWWNIWYLPPDLGEAEYGQLNLPGVPDPQNSAAPLALQRVFPRELVPGDYRLEVWGVQQNAADSMRREVRITVVE